MLELDDEIKETEYLVIIRLKGLIFKDLLRQANWGDVWDV